jgi:hypothetical protein
MLSLETCLLGSSKVEDHMTPETTSKDWISSHPVAPAADGVKLASGPGLSSRDYPGGIILEACRFRGCSGSRQRQQERKWQRALRTSGSSQRRWQIGASDARSSGLIPYKTTLSCSDCGTPLRVDY